MGFLHEGHLALVEKARADCEKVVATIFVNPTQFGEAADLENYPRNETRDCELLKAAGVDAVFIPDPSEMYHPQAETIVETTELASTLMGALRPGHFRGVCTVVSKLLNIVQPDRAYFGEKDYQQLLVIRTMVRDLDIPVDIVGVPTQREADGLAMSSRNVRLSPEARQNAVALSAALSWAEDQASRGSVTIETLRAGITEKLAATPGADVKSVDIQDAATLADVTGPLEDPVVILLAVRFEPVLLIDQRVVSPAS